MKRKLFSGLMFLLIVCIALSMVTLSACNNNEEPEKPVDYSQDTSDMLADVIQKLQGSYNVGEKFGVDVSAAFLIDDKTEKNDDVKFTLTAKGNADLAKGAQENATNAFIELAMTKAEVKTTIVGIAYEVIDGAPYFFVNVMGETYAKINGYSLTALYAMLVPEADVSASIDIGSIAPLLSTAIFGEKGEVKDNVYTFDFDLAQLMVSVNSLLKNPLIANLISSTGITNDQIDAVVAKVFGNLSYTDNGVQVAVTSLATLTEYVKREMSFEGKLAFAFDANDKFASANLSFDYAKKGTPVANYTLAVDKAFVGTTTSAIDTFANFALDADARKNNDAINALNFKVRGTVTGLDAEGNTAHTYEAIIDSDIDAFRLFDLLKGTDKANIVATLKKLGYFHFEVNEVAGETKTNIITLHSKFDEGRAILNVHAYKAGLAGEIGVGGVYDFDALIDAIDIYIDSKASEPVDPSEPSEPGQEETVVDKIKNTINKVKEYLEFIHFDNIAEDGLTIDIRAIVYKLTGISGMAEGVVDALLGNESLNFKVETPTFGTVGESDYVKTETIACNIKNRNDFKNETKDKHLASVTSLGDYSLKVVKGTTQYNALTQQIDKLVLGKGVVVKGTALDGTEVEASAYILGVKNYDPNTVGKQTVTFILTTLNDFNGCTGLLESFANIVVPEELPLGGALAFTTEIEVVEPTQDTTVEFVNFKDQSEESPLAFLKGTSVFSNIAKSSVSKVTYVVIDGVYYPVNEEDFVVLDKDNKVVKLEDGKIQAEGNYTVRFAIGEVKADYFISVESGYIKRVDGKEEVEQIALGGVWNFSKYEAHRVDANGDNVVSGVTETYALGSSAKKLADLFDITKDANGNDVYTLKKDLAMTGKKFVVQMKFEYAGSQRTVKQEIEIVSPVGKVTSTPSSVYVGASINDKFAVTVNDVVYKVVYNDGTFEAVAEDGTKLQNFTLEMTWKTRGAVQINENGVITNVLNKNASGSANRKDTINYTLTIGEYSYVGTFTVNELYAGNITSKFTTATVLDGKISNVNYLTYTVDGEKATLQFKYGKEGYGIYIKDTDTKVYDVTMTVYKYNGTKVDETTAISLVDGKFAEAGKYKVTYSVNINDGINQMFYHDVTVTAA